jgi:hypothetical protein
MLTIPGHKGNANQNTRRFHLTSVRIAIIQKHHHQQMLAKLLGEKEPSYTAGGNVS